MYYITQEDIQMILKNHGFYQINTKKGIDKNVNKKVSVVKNENSLSFTYDDYEINYEFKKDFIFNLKYYIYKDSIFKVTCKFVDMDEYDKGNILHVLWESRYKKIDTYITICEYNILKYTEEMLKTMTVMDKDPVPGCELSGVILWPYKETISSFIEMCVIKSIDNIENNKSKVKLKEQ